MENKPEIKPKKKYIYDNKKYTDAYYERHIGEKKQCDICNKDYDMFNFSHHIKTKKHINNKEKKELRIKQEEILQKKLDFIKSNNIDDKTYQILMQLL